MNKAKRNNIFSFSLKKKGRGFISVFLRKSRNKIIIKNAELDKLRLAFEQTPSAIFILDKNFRFEYVNSSFVSLSGYSKEELLNRTVGELFYRNDLPELNNEIVESLLNGKKWEGELLTYNKNGLTYWANTIAAPYKDENDSVEGYIIIQQDTTEKRKMEVSLKESEQFYRTLIENSMEPIALTQNGKFILVNSAFLHLFGYTSDEIFRMDPQSFIAPEDRDRVMDIHYKRMRGETDKQNYKASFIHKSGKSILTQLNASTIQLHGENASFITLSDITERTAMEMALRESEMKYRELAEMLPLAVYEHDLNGILTYLNKLGRVKLGIDSLEKPICAFSLIQANEFEQIKSTMTDAEYFTSPSNVYTAIRTNGEKFPVMIFASAVISDGKKIGTRGIFMDMTEHLAIENALRVSEKKYRELADMLPQTVYELDTDGYVTYLNRTGQLTFGLNDNTIRVHSSEGIIAEDRLRFRNNISISNRGNKSIIADEYTALRKDGTTFPAMIYGAAMIENDKFVGTRGLVVDISERKTMENTLKKNEEHYRHVIQTLQEGLYIIQDDKFVFVNDAFLNILGYTKDELLKIPFLDALAPECRDAATEAGHQRWVIEKNKSWSDEYMLLHHDGQTRIPVILSTNITELDGILTSVGTAKDITDRIRAEAEIKEAHRRLEEINQNQERTIKERTKELTNANLQLLNMQKANLQSQFDVLKQQVNPHFLFNSLNVLTSLIKLEPDLAEKFSEQLSKVYRYVLENKDNELVDLNTELNFLDAYIFLLNIRFVDKLIVNIAIPESRHGDQIIPLAMQLLIENAIKHNIMSKSQPLIIDIFIDEDNYINVINNLQERPTQLVSTGVGLKNIENRYLLLNNTKPTFVKSKTHFIARVPLVIFE